MSGTAAYLWLIPAMPLAAAGLSAVVPQRCRRFAATASIAAMAVATVLSAATLAAMVLSPGQPGTPGRTFHNFRWLQFGTDWIELGWVLDPLSAVMLVMVSVVGLLIFIYSVGYMARDTNFTRFFCFLSLFAAAMLGLLIANSLLLLFICWEIVGLTSYLLIGFWYHKPSAAAAAKKAFITTRIGDLALLLGIVWLYAETHTLVFYDSGSGCLEAPALAQVISHTTVFGLLVSTAIGLLIFAGAAGKSGQVPLHVWLPDAMEGPTPVSALIHAATMVAAGVFLVARVYPLLAAHPEWESPQTAVLQTIAWVGAVTALFAALIAVAQTDIKRILAYSTVSQLGFMMLGLATGGVAVGMFHLIAHACFKALLFLGAGSAIHGCHEEQDIRNMGGLRKGMPLTFATYAIGMLALSGFPLLFSGFWSKDEILHAAHGWPASGWPFYLGLTAAFLTAFYMTRQMAYVFFGNARFKAQPEQCSPRHAKGEIGTPHESPWVMTAPLIVLAAFTVLLGGIGTPAWPWFAAFIKGEIAVADLSRFRSPEFLHLLALSSIVVFAGLGLGSFFYGREPLRADGPDAIEKLWPNVFALLRRKFLVDEIYAGTVVALNDWWGRTCDSLDRLVLDAGVQLISYLVIGLSWVSRSVDEYVLKAGFDRACDVFRTNGTFLRQLQNGQVQFYLRILAAAVALLGLFLLWGCARP